MGRNSSQHQHQPMEHRQAQLDLRTFKTLPCPREGDGPHDRRACPYYHFGPSSKDRRRDPYSTPYLPSDTGATGVERAYHPLVFRTCMCSYAPTRLSNCPFGDVCAFAHSEAELRAAAEAEAAYEEAVAELHCAPSAPKAGTAQVYEAVLAATSDASKSAARPAGRHAYGEQNLYEWLTSDEMHDAEWQPEAREHGITVETLPLLPWQAALLQRPDSVPRLWEAMQDAALQHVCQLKVVKNRHGSSGNRDVPDLRIQGLHAAEGKEAVRQLLACPPADCAWVKTETFPPRVCDLILEMLETAEGRACLADRAVIIHHQECSITVAAAPMHARAAAAVCDKIAFWQKIEAPRYGQLHRCDCCFTEQRNPEEGASCPGGHFFCSVEPCFQMLVAAQLPNIRHQARGQLVCPVCSEAFPDHTCAKHLSHETYAQLLDAVVEARVAERYAELEGEFEVRLKQAVEELRLKHARLDSADPLKVEAERLAAKARNKALNLACPECGTVYFDFEGCMALRCASCSANFCAYCHKLCTDARGTHQHVRECDDNRTRNGSYYANAQQIEAAQRRLRIKQLKKFLRGFKKEKQNAIVFELARDLASHGIDRAALLSVGDLMVEEPGNQGGAPAE